MSPVYGLVPAMVGGTPAPMGRHIAGGGAGSRHGTGAGSYSPNHHAPGCSAL